MTMTEEEAKTKWCPFVRWVYVPGPNAHAFNNRITDKAEWNKPDDPSEPVGNNCVASACMAWRWRHSPEWAASAAREAPMANAQKPFVASGYCGLGGNP